MSKQHNYYTVKKGDTLRKIANANGTTASELAKINGIKNQNVLRVGQRIALRKEAVCGVEALFLDRDRNPIKGLQFRIEQCGQHYDGKTGENGKTKQVLTQTPDDMVNIWVKRFDGNWKRVTTVVSGFGNKLVTLVSAHIVIEAKTEKHPDIAPNTLPDTKERPKPKYPTGTLPAPTMDKKELGFKTTATKTPDGKPLTIVEGDIPDLSFLGEYNGEVMTEADYEWAAKELDIEKAAIKAFAVVESGGGGFIIMGKMKVPKILYERHYFSDQTGHQYSAKYPDISLPVGYYIKDEKYLPADSDYKKKHNVPEEVNYYRPISKKNDSKEKQDHATNLESMVALGVATVDKDKYLFGAPNYKRLVKAYQLNKEAALQSCSWGAFQIMGTNWKKMGYSSVFDFVKAISISEKEQIKAFVLFVKKVKPAIVIALKNKDWEMAAKLYNGANYKKFKYDKLLSDEYKKIKGKE